MLAAIPLLHKLIGGAVLVALATLAILWQMADRRADKWQEQAVKLSQKLDSISTTRNQQAETTAGNIERVRIVYRDAQSRAERVESAPLKGECRTPEGVLQADL